MSPRPNAEALLRLYANEGYYRNRYASPYGYPDYLAERPLLEQLFAARIAEIEALRPRRGRLLDVGCATGVLLEVAGGHGWDVQGVDVSDFSVAVCRERGLPVHHGDLVSARLPAASFDVAVLDDTIEYLRDPRREMEELHRVLAPGGLLTMNTPNEAGTLRRLSGAHWFHLKPPEHLYYFSPCTLEDLLGRTGFRVFSVRTSGKFVTLQYLCERKREASATRWRACSTRRSAGYRARGARSPCPSASSSRSPSACSGMRLRGDRVRPRGGRRAGSAAPLRASCSTTPGCFSARPSRTCSSMVTRSMPGAPRFRRTRLHAARSAGGNP